MIHATYARELAYKQLTDADWETITYIDGMIHEALKEDGNLLGIEVFARISPLLRSYIERQGYRIEEATGSDMFAYVAHLIDWE